MKIEQYNSDDYAMLTSGNQEFYYGYEKPDTNTEEWCFVISNDGKEVLRFTRTLIENTVDNIGQLNTPQDYLLAGIGMWLSLKDECENSIYSIKK